MAHHVMTEGEARAFLASDPPHTAALATVRPDGRPHVAPIWFAVDLSNGDVLFNTGLDTVKGRNIAHRPRAALCVDDERPPFSFVLVEGDAEIIREIDEVRHWATVIGGRYMGAERAEEFGRRNGVPGELLVRLHPERITGSADLAD